MHSEIGAGVAASFLLDEPITLEPLLKQLKLQHAPWYIVQGNSMLFEGAQI